MKEITVVGKVYETKKYELFKLRSDNRPIKDSNVNALTLSIEQMGQRHPIAVDNNFVVHDGQHRLEACKKLGIPVKYIIDETPMSTTNIAQLQSASKGWGNKDYAHSFAEANNPNYKLYNLFVKDYPEFNHTCVVMFLGNRTTRSKADEENFRIGTFTVKSYAAAKKNAEIIKEMGRYYKGYYLRGFVSAILKLLSFKEFELPRLMRKLPKRCKDIMDFSKTEDYLEALIHIYNWKETKKVYFQ